VPLPSLLAGPIVRRAAPGEVWFWFASSREISACTPKVTAYDRAGQRDKQLNRSDGWYPLEQAELRVAQLGRNLWVAIVSARPSTPFVADRIYGYDLIVTFGSGGSTLSTKVSGMGLGIGYAPFELPTFVLARDQRRLAHGSCRRPGATGRDAFPVFDEWMGRQAADVATRPSALILTGDQIYADDVALPLFSAVHRLAAEISGYVEHLPRKGDAPIAVDEFPVMKAPSTAAEWVSTDMKRFAKSRKALTSRVTSPIGFTTEDGEAHLLSFAEYAAMYLLVWNPDLCRDYGVDNGSDENLRGFPAAVAASRRVLANVATYMVFDDHEITDDWNLDADWENATRNPIAQRILANGLAAYWAFQGWGNDPNQFNAQFTEAITQHLRAAASAVPAARLLAPMAPAAKTYDDTLLKRHWSFVAPTSPPALCVDTRTRRETPSGTLPWMPSMALNKPPILSGSRVWPFLDELRIRHRLKSGDPLLIVLPTPLLPHRSMMYIQDKKYSWPRDRYEGDFEWYGNNPAQRAELIGFLREKFNPPALIVFSGDVHHGSVIDGLYVHGASRSAIDSGDGDWAVRVLQITSSPIKNVKRDAYESHWYLGGTDAGNIGESVIPQYENQYATKPDGTALGLRADARLLTGPLGRETYIPENHLCVVDLPAGGRVGVTFLGVKDDKLAAAQTSMSTRNDPHRFNRAPFPNTFKDFVPDEESPLLSVP
jgi:hypothetical protein